MKQEPCDFSHGRFSGYIIVPIGNTFAQAFQGKGGYSFEVFKEYFSNTNNLRVVSNTIILGLGSVLVCGIMGISLALYMTFACDKHKKIIHILLLSPMMIPGVIMVIACIQLYGESGIVTKSIEILLFFINKPYDFSGLKGILFVVAYTQYVYFYLNVYVALKYVDYSTVEAAKGMGASRLRVFFDVIWPVITPAVITSTIITFASGISSFSAPNLIGGGFKVLSTQIVRSKANNHMDIASVQVIILLLMGISFMILLQYYGKKYGVVSSLKSQSYKVDNRKKDIFTFVCKIIIEIQIIMIMLPIITIVYLSFVSTHSIMTTIFPRDFTLENYQMIFQKSRVLQPILNSLKMSLMAVVVGLIITVPVSYLVIKKDTTYNRLAKFIIMLPWSMPASAIAVNLINTFNQKSIFAFNESLIGGFYILPIAYTIYALPLLFSSNEVAMKSINLGLEESSRSLGAGRIKTFYNVIIPNMMPGIISGAILVFIRTIGEYTMSALLYGVYNRPISISIVTNMQEFKIGVSMAYGVLVIGICYIALGIIFKLDRKRFT
ncbi:ABC transporter permease [Clostridioides sp. ZZV14-6154]|uniref:ABC transporter permease n=1 Tax=Clostridioides sp. ZZV14-6154 TaxID=2811495 RepID=UPI001D115602